jgi:primary-amine oxidase
MDRSSRRVAAAFLLALAPLVLGATRLRALEDPPPPPPDDEKKPFSEVVDVPDRELRDLLGTPPDRDERAGPGGGGACFLQQCNQNIYCFPGTNSTCLLQTFQETQWRICIYATYNKGYAVGPVDLKRTPASPWRRILYKASPAEIFTAYHSGSPHFYDTQYGNGVNWRRTVDSNDAGPFGLPLYLSQDFFFGPTIVAECKDRGVAWMCKGPLSSYVRRGKELLLWGVFDAGNYDYILEYGFRDDGTISFRTGATGYNSPAQPDVAHGHDVLWRLDMDLNGPSGDTPRFGRHIEPYSSSTDAIDLEDPFAFGYEGSEIWVDKEFNTLLVEDTATNADLNPMGYELQPERTGSGRHYATGLGCTENWSQADFWVTRWHAAEDNAWAVPWSCPDPYIASATDYTANHEKTINRDNVLWYYASAHHDPIDEDRDPGLMWGVTRMHWFGFTLEPHNYFDYNPLTGLGVCPRRAPAQGTYRKRWRPGARSSSREAPRRSSCTLGTRAVRAVAPLFSSVSDHATISKYNVAPGRIVDECLRDREVLSTILQVQLSVRSRRDQDVVVLACTRARKEDDPAAPSVLSSRDARHDMLDTHLVTQGSGVGTA